MRTVIIIGRCQSGPGDRGEAERERRGNASKGIGEQARPGRNLDAQATPDSATMQTFYPPV